MSVASLREQLHQYVETAAELDLKALLAHIEEDKSQDGDRWNDPRFLAEVRRREQEVKDGDIRLSTWEEVKARAKQHKSDSKAA